MPECSASCFWPDLGFAELRSRCGILHIRKVAVLDTMPHTNGEQTNHSVGVLLTPLFCLEIYFVNAKYENLKGSGFPDLLNR